MTAPTAPEVGDLVTPGGIWIGQWDAGSPEWLAARRIAVGGSEIAAVLGLSPWESRFSLWHRKLGLAADVQQNPAMEWGQRLESVLLGKYLDEHPDLEVGPCGTFVNTDRRWQLANPDALLRHRTDTAAPLRLWEAKVSRDDVGWGEPGTDEVPPYYLAQVRWYLDTLALPAADVSVLVAGQEYREYHVQADAADAQLMRDAAAEFVESLRTRARPDIDQHSQTYQVVRELHPDIDPVDVELPPALAEQYRRAVTDLAAAEAAKTEAASRVLDAVGRGRRAMCLGEQIALRVPGRGDNPPFLRPARALTKAAVA